MEKSLPGLILTVIIAIVLVSALLIPTIADATKTDETFVNTGVYFDSNPETSHTLQYDGSVLTVDGGAITLPADGQTPVVVLDGLNFIHKNNANMVIVHNGYKAFTSADLTITGGTITGTYVSAGNTSSVSVSYSDISIAVSSKTDNVWSSAPIHVNNGDLISASGLLNFNDSAGSSHPLNWGFSGTVGGACAAETGSAVSSQYTFSNVAINYSSVSGYEDLYSISSISFDVHYVNPNDSSVIADFTVTSINMIAPESTTSEITDHLTTAEIAILSIVPILVILAILGIVIARFRNGE